jgi:hypothetical protein
LVGHSFGHTGTFSGGMNPSRSSTRSACKRREARVGIGHRSNLIATGYNFFQRRASFTRSYLKQFSLTFTSHLLEILLEISASPFRAIECKICAASYCTTSSTPNCAPSRGTIADAPNPFVCFGYCVYFD